MSCNLLKSIVMGDSLLCHFQLPQLSSHCLFYCWNVLLSEKGKWEKGERRFENIVHLSIYLLVLIVIIMALESTFFKVFFNSIGQTNPTSGHLIYPHRETISSSSSCLISCVHCSLPGPTQPNNINDFSGQLLQWCPMCTSEQLPHFSPSSHL